MKSKIFSIIDVEGSEGLKRDCIRLFKIKNFKDLLPLFQQMQQVTDHDERVRLCSENALNFGVEAVDLSSAYSILRYISNQLLKTEFENDKPEDIASDLIFTAGNESQSRQSELVTLINATKAYLTEERSQIRAKEFGDSVIPKLYSFNGVVDIRAVFDREEIPKTNDYKPIFLGAVPSVLLRIETSSNSNDEITIQLTEKQLHGLSEMLDNLKKELDLAKLSLGLKS